MVVASPAERAEGGAAVKQLKLLRRDDNLLLGQVYRLISFEDVLKGLAHCDIKGKNILIGEGGLKIANFGCAKWAESDEPAAFAGTPAYLAPEVSRGEEQGFQKRRKNRKSKISEMRKNEKMEKAAKSISDLLGCGSVSSIETVISKGGKVVEKDVVKVIELLMNQLLRLDGIIADGDVKLQRKMQVRRVQKYIETLDVLKMKNSMPIGNGVEVPLQRRFSNGDVSSPVDQQQDRVSFGHSLIDSPVQQKHQPSRHSASGASVVIKTQWETFDSAPGLMTGGPSTSNGTVRPAQPSLTWDLL
ncbi:hypothetical protein CASFOL_016483 [Castilleja foliolosa]|uniref:Protein kinase domain-containing protein n=1 Tax=Castilleja foliolosa TaxID=1961234 RepID=A0ABD3DKW6_9LAMI